MTRLPKGIRSRPPLAAPRPAVAGRILRLLFWVLLFVAPLLLQVSFQVRGIQWQYRSHQLSDEINQQRLHRRTLRAERARLTTPERLRREARRLNLGPARQGHGPVKLASNPAQDASRD